MKKLLAYFMSLAMLVVTVGTSAVLTRADGEPVNVLVNGDFETGDLTGWSDYEGAAILENNPEVFNGNYSMQMRPQIGGYLNGFLSQTIEVEPNTDYQVGASVKTNVHTEFKIFVGEEKKDWINFNAGEEWSSDSRTVNTGEATTLRVELMENRYDHEEDYFAFYDDVFVKDSSGNNLLVNGDFETGDLTGWSDYDGAAIMEKNRVFDGNYSVQMGPAIGGWDYGVLSQTVDVDPNSEYVVGASVKTNGETQFKVFLDNAQDPIDWINFKASDQWSSDTRTIQTGTATKLRIELMENRYGHEKDYFAYYDNITVTKVGGEEPEEPDPEEPTLSKELVNGDFETGDLTGWSDYDGASILSDDRVYDGSHSLQMGPFTGGGWTYGVLSQEIEVEPNSQYVVGGAAKTNGNTQLKVFLGDATDPADYISFSASDEWSYGERTISTGTATKLRIELMENRDSASNPTDYFAFYDNITVKKVKSEEPEEPDPEEPTLSKELVNGDFETGDLTGWSDYDGAAILEGEEVFDGDYSLQMGPAIGGANYGFLSQTIEVDPNSRYVVGASAKTNGGTRFKIFVGDAASETDYIDFKGDGWSSGDRTVSTGEATTLRIELTEDRYGHDDDYYAYYDNITVTKVSGEDPDPDPNPDPDPDPEQPPTTGNLLKNPGFEEEFAEDDWSEYEFSERTAEAKHSGEYGLKLLGTGGQYGGVSQTVKVKPNTDYTFTMYVYPHAATHVKILNKEQVNGAEDKLHETYFSAKDSWELLTVNFNSGDREELVIFMMNAHNDPSGASYAYFDDASLTEDEELPEPEGINRVVNPGFELGTLGWVGASENAGDIYTITDQDAHSGDYSLLLTGVGNFNACYQIIQVEPNTDYLFGVWAKVVEGNYGQVVTKVLTVDESTMLSEDQILPSGGLKWTYTQVGFNSGENTEVKLWIGDGGAGEAYLDDFFIAKVSDMGENKAIQDKDTGITVEFVRLHEEDTFDDFSGVKVLQSEIPAAAQTMLKDRGMAALGQAFTIQALDSKGQVITDFGERTLRITLPLTDDQADLPLYLMRLGKTPTFVSTEYEGQNLVLSLYGEELDEAMQFVLATLDYGTPDPGEPSDPSNPDDPTDPSDPGEIPTTGVGLPWLAMALLFPASGAAMLTRKKSLRKG